MEKAIKGIYLIERIGELSENEKRYYVGQARDIFKRLNQHCTEKNPGIDNAISALGTDKFSFQILEKVERVKDLDVCEKKWIEHYKNLYGDGQMYNISQTTNARNGIDVEIRKKIKELFMKDIGQSIYAIAEHFDVPYEDVIKIRKPLLRERGLKWENIKKKIIDVKTDAEAENWRGGVLTLKLADRVNKILEEPGKTIEDVPRELISRSDLEIFMKSIKSGEEYNYAPPIDNNINII